MMTGFFQLLVILVQLGGFSAEQDAASGFFEEKENDDDECRGNNGMRVEDPAPGGSSDNHTGDEWCQASSEERRCREEGHGRVAVVGVIDVTDYTADHGGERCC